MKIAFRVLVSMNRLVSAFKNIQTIFGGAKELDGLKVTKEFKGHNGPAFQCFTGLSEPKSQGGNLQGQKVLRF
jgi:hypothetical protein